MTAKLSRPDYGGNLGHAFFYVVLKLFGLRPAYFCLAFVATYYALCRPSVRQSTRPYLERRFPGQSPLRRLWVTIRYLYSFGQVLIDQAAVGILGPDRFQMDFPDEEKLKARALEGRGLLLLGSHIGPWQAAMTSFGRIPIPVHVLFRLYDHERGRHFFELAEKRPDFHILFPEDFLGGLVELTNALSSGECVVLMGDRTFGARGQRVSFLGGEATFPIAPYRLVSVTGADLVMVLTTRTGPYRYRIEQFCLTDDPPEEFPDLPRTPSGKPDWRALGRQRAQDILMRRYAAQLERHVAAHPFQWFNFFDFWAEEKDTEKV
jgi:predicted LPLAT superfamily acyltransferase